MDVSERRKNRQVVDFGDNKIEKTEGVTARLEMFFNILRPV